MVRNPMYSLSPVKHARDRIDGWMDGWMHGCMDGWMHGWMDAWMDGALH